MLDVRNLRFRYRKDAACWHFSFSVAAGECLAISGASGSGKSTLLNLLAGFLTPESGSICWQGQELTGTPPWERPMTSVFQENNLFEHLDVATNIGLGIHPGLKLSTEQRQAISEGLQQLGLAGFEQRMPGDLSGGQRQRVAVLRALLRPQPILLLDEPLTGLDPEARTLLRSQLLQQKQQGRLLILASHDAEDREVLADRTLLL